MNILFTNAVLWPLALLVALPLIVHLFARARPPVYDFSSVEFIRRALRVTQRIRKPKDWLLLALRTAAVAAAVLLFLRPVLFAHGGGLFERRNVVIVLDASASMAWSDGGQTRFAVACAEASEILAGLSSRDAANVILAGAEPRAVFPAMGGNVGYLQDEIRRARLTSEAMDADAALRQAARLLDGQEGKKEICVVSDFQASNWRGVKPRLPPDVGMTCVGVARGEAPNAAIARVEIEPARPLPGEEITVLCEIANYSGAPERKTVVLAMESTRASREVVLPAWGRATATFRQKVASLSPYAAAVSISEDHFPGDDRRWGLVEPTDVLRIGIVAAGETDATAAAWTRAVRSLGWARAESLSLAGPAGPETRIDALLISGWNGAEPGRIRRYLESGVPVVWYPAFGTPLSRIAQVLTNAAPSGDAVAAWEDKPDGIRLTVAAPDHAVFRIFSGGEFGDPARGRVRGRLAMPAARLPPGESLLAYSDGVPAVWWCRGPRPLVLWNLPLGTSVSTVQDQGEFVPFLGELIMEARRGFADAAMPPREYLPGQKLSLSSGMETYSDDVRLKGPDDVEVAVPALPSAGGMRVSDRIEKPGLYVWTIGERVVGRDVVNFPALESDLRPLSKTEIAAMGAASAASGRDVREWQAGIALWPRLLWAALVLLLCEGMVAAFDSGRRTVIPKPESRNAVS